MKYGLVVYKKSDNIGDDILSYAAIRFLPSVDYIIDRENIDIFKPEKMEIVNVIVNGWFLHSKISWPPSPYINPLFVGVHFTGNPITRSRFVANICDEYLDGLGKEYLMKKSPIGCRDYYTLEKMKMRNIPAYFSGCLTLTLEKFGDVLKSDKIILVDVSEKIYKKCVEIYGQENIEIITHNINIEEQGKPWRERKVYVECLLKKYQAAKIVITTRLHCALPCLALGTNVLLVVNDSEDDKARKGSFLQYINYTTEEEFISNFDTNELGKLKNDNTYKTLRNELIAACTNFINEDSNDIVNKSLPNLDNFNEYYVKRIIWQRRLLDVSLNSKNSKIRELEAELVMKNNYIQDQQSQLQDCKMHLSDIKSGLSFKIGRIITWLPRKLLGRK